MEQETQLIVVNEIVNKLYHNLEKEIKKVHQKVDEVQILNNQYEAQLEQARKQREEVEHEFEPAYPFLKKAYEVLDSIEMKDIVELKCGKKPLDIIKYIMDTILILCQAPLIPIQIEERVFNKREGKAVLFLKESWEESGQIYYGQLNFMKNLKEYDKHRINEETIELLEPYLNQQDDWFNVTFATKASRAFSFLIQWVFALYQYYQIYKTIESKNYQLVIFEGRLTTKSKILETCREDLNILIDQCKKIKETYLKWREEKNELELKVAECKKWINTVSVLMLSIFGSKENQGLDSQQIQTKN